MRKLKVTLIALVLVASACSGGDSAVVSDVAPAEAATADTQTAEPAEEAANAPAAEPTAAPAAAEAQDAEVCQAGTGLNPDRVEVDQIPGDGREDTLSALRDLGNSDHPEPLIDLNRILSGGPPPDGIPPVDNPIFQTASTIDWMQCNEPVLSLRVGDETRAYPVQIMTWHELVNDTFGDVPVTVSYCPLCNSSLAYRRDIGDRVVTFGTSGSLFNSSLVMYDRETESLWTHFNGKAVVGALTGTELELLPMQTVSWKTFLERHPDALVLSRNTGHERAYGRNPYSGYDDVTSDPFLFDGDADPRLPAKQRVVGIRRGGDNAAVVLDALADAGVIVTEVAGDSLSVWHLPGTATALEDATIAGGRDVGATGVFLPVVDGQALTFTRSGEGFTDAETGSTWDILGVATDGQLAGSVLEPIEHLDTFWFALAAFEPDTRVISS